ncbi:SKG6 domain containing protein [Colletotrichum asianum]
MISVILLAYSLILSFSSVFIEAACYYPNGSIAPNDTPCRDDTAESTCCGQGYACLSNGMCQATGSELQKDGATELVRGACTDRSWRSSSCPLFCINPETDNVGGGIGVAKCQGTTQELYYCINSVQDQVNCTAKQNVLFFQRDDLGSVHNNNNTRTQCISISISSNLCCHIRPVESTEPEPHNHKQCRAEPDK